MLGRVSRLPEAGVLPNTADPMTTAPVAAALRRKSLRDWGVAACEGAGLLRILAMLVAARGPRRETRGQIPVLRRRRGTACRTVAMMSVQYSRKNNQLPADAINKKQPNRTPTLKAGATPVRRIQSRY